MPEFRAQRTLVKSPPELWSEISDAQTLARRLSAFGEVRITRMEPETAVAWEGASVRGAVELEASGWGTKVTVTAEPLTTSEPAPEPAPAEQETIAFDTAAVARAAVSATTQDTPEETSADQVATGTDIPLPTGGHAPREGLLARLKLWWDTGLWHPAEPAPTPTPDDMAPDPAPTPDRVRSAQLSDTEATRSPEVERPQALAPPEVEPAVVAEPPSAAGAIDARADEPDLEGLLVAVLDDLGSAHHRPFSRA